MEKKGTWKEVFTQGKQRVKQDEGKAQGGPRRERGRY